MNSYIRWCRVVFALVYGAGYALGPPSFTASPSFAVLKSFPISIQVWGVIFMICAAVMARTEVVGYGLTVFFWTIWGICLALGPITSWGALTWPFLFVAVNSGELARWGRQRVELVREQKATGFLEARRISRAHDRAQHDRKRGRW